MKYFATIFLGVLLFVNGTAQDRMMSVYKEQYRTINKNVVAEAKTIIDINSGYPASWINDYISVEVFSTTEGEVHSSISDTPEFTPEQIALLRNVELGSEIGVKVKYRSEQAFKPSVKELEFGYAIVPAVEAQYPGGIDSMEAYVRNNVISKLEKMETSDLEYASVSFTIDTDGKVADVTISKSSQIDNADQLILEAFSSMPLWSPAKDTNSVNVRQDLEFSIGLNIGC